MGQLTNDYHINCEFNGVGFSIKEKGTNKILLRGVKRGNLYTIKASLEAQFSVRFQAMDSVVWHQQPGHPQPVVVQALRSKGFLHVRGKNKFRICESYQIGKLSKLPFKPRFNNDFGLFEKIHCDLWGPSPTLSTDKFSYYTCIVDDYSRYMWLVPLCKKSDFFFWHFRTFVNYIERQFSRCIKILQSDGGGEFGSNAFTNYLQELGIVHQLSCPYTPEKNGLVERRHRIICELGLTMLRHSGMPKRFWVEAFPIAVFLVNRLPSLANSNDSHFYKVFGKHP